MPLVSKVILFKTMFRSHKLEELGKKAKGEELLEISEEEEGEIQKEFEYFYEMVLEEFKKFGKVVHFRCCKNLAAHLRGNVLVEFEKLEDSLHAFLLFDERPFDGFVLHTEFTLISEWKLALCSFSSNGGCPRAKECNFIHPFMNPNDEFPVQIGKKKKEVELGYKFFVKRQAGRGTGLLFEDKTNQPFLSSHNVLNEVKVSKYLAEKPSELQSAKKHLIDSRFGKEIAVIKEEDVEFFPSKKNSRIIDTSFESSVFRKEPVESELESFLGLGSLRKRMEMELGRNQRFEMQGYEGEKMRANFRENPAKMNGRGTEQEERSRSRSQEKLRDTRNSKGTVKTTG